MGLSPETPFGFGYTVLLRAFCLDVRESIGNAGMRDSLGIVQLSGKPGEKREHCKVSVKELAPGGRKVFVFLLLALECPQGKARPTWI